MGPLQSILGDHIIAETGLSRYAAVTSIIRNGSWQWPWTNNEALRVIKENLSLQQPPDSGEQDVVRWEPDRSGIFSIRSAWKSIRSRSEPVEWVKLIWFPGRIPKAAFCLWLAVKGRPQTQDRLYICDPSMKCLLCNSCMEDHEHLFFKCRVSSIVWRMV